MADTCNEHSGICANINNLKAEIIENKTELHETKDWARIKIDKLDNKIEQLAKDFNSKMETGLTDIKTMIEKKEASSKNTKWLIITSFIAPTIVGIMLLVGSKLI